MSTRSLGSVVSGVALAAVSLVLGGCDPAPAGYELVLLRSPGGELSSRAVAISETGYVVGEVTAADGTTSTVRWAPDGTPTVVAPGVGATYARVNDRGDVAVGRTLWRDGVATTVAPASRSRIADLTEDGRVLVTPTDLEPRHPYVWDDGVVTTVVVPDGAYGPGAVNVAWAMDEDGRVVGRREVDLGVAGTWWWEDGVTSDLPNPANPSVPGDVYGEAMNGSGQVAGWFGGTDDAFLWDDGTYTDLGRFPGGGDLRVEAIGDAGHVVGGGYAGPGTWHAFVWHDGVLTDLGTLAGLPFARAVDVNVHGDAVGVAHDDRSSDVRAVLWRDGEVHDLGGFDAGDTRAEAINGRGEVVGTSVDANGLAHAVLWRPTG